ncbi:tRNA A37 threonylcarbamoyladenosine modification protein TsaB (TsaB) (PDB:1OKJ) [Commensalibacter communis]|uniref:tRNA A37 threonylcarbamoyladenosine modification protein TsaB (TsaB) n=1 Tax=Commensalibacter communis TaxID=2972786 RepID=A0A9W4TQ37_9PROT|nr:tRNA (adenosine(37)-N6)-threonylcarbamoyltransferase complex dimerization subunit type 1 TsaB [Commensalibacter communis]CAI3948693.1 tRNA A37 threonylcarbamoyladenosine modification protein TsaB (TsaB) (PDB:1OKJ) [Commensalibacter communis]CAI3951157.1 tRNA A37 threonylcarbamoyladenosine modification protein TsaB (TsaB) (PDB:1OKJ) [Commensalibacter communis]CAI3951844.1 tRNA A37 threonylcarbamoyladenosine modification protein TsaB (TsaB) (PDB:1OKJ) [Commensalibacter communis]CAI3952787.1 tR
MMSDCKTILVMNGASSSETAPNYIAIVQKRDSQYSVLAEEKTTLKGGSERFPTYFQSFIEQNILKPDQIDLIAVMVGPGSFTGLRASIAFALGMQVGLGCPAVGLRRGEVLFPFLSDHSTSQLIWHITQARRGRVFVETNQSSQVIAYNDDEILFPDEPFFITGEAVSSIEDTLPSHAQRLMDVNEADALMMAKIADQYNNTNYISNPICPLYVDAPEAKLPKKGLRKAPI